MHLSLRIAAGSLAVSLAVLAIKYAAYLLTGSVALYSDALESIINVVTAAAAIVASRTASSLNSRVNCRLSMTHLLLHKTPNSMSSEPAAAHSSSFSKLNSSPKIQVS